MVLEYTVLLSLLVFGVNGQDPVVEIDTGFILGRTVDYKGKIIKQNVVELLRLQSYKKRLISHSIEPPYLMNPYFKIIFPLLFTLLRNLLQYQDARGQNFLQYAGTPKLLTSVRGEGGTSGSVVVIFTKYNFD